MKFLFINDDGSFGFKDNSINEILDEDVQITDDIYNQFFSAQEKGIHLKIKNINGSNFEDIFQEYTPVIDTNPMPSQAELIQQIKTMQDTIDQLVLSSL